MPPLYSYHVPLIDFNFFTPSPFGRDLPYTLSVVPVVTGDSGAMVDESYITDEDTRTQLWVTFNYFTNHILSYSQYLYVYRSDGQHIAGTTMSSSGHWRETRKVAYGHIATGGITRFEVRYINTAPATAGSMGVYQVSIRLVRV